MRGCPAYKVDAVLSSYNVSKAHWILTIINVHEKTIMIIHLLDPTSITENLSEEVILNGVKTIFETYAEQFEVR